MMRRLTCLTGRVVSRTAVLGVASGALLLQLAGSAAAQEITQILDTSGGGVAAFDAPRGVALDNPWALAADAAGNVYIPGNFSHNAFKVSITGDITLLIDSTGDGTSPMLAPVGIAVDGLGNAYVAGSDTHNVFRIEPDGTITKILDVNGDGSGRILLEPFELVADAVGTVYVGGATSDNVFKVTLGGTITQILGADGDGQGEIMDFPGALMVAPDDTVYVTGYWSNNVFSISPGGTVTTLMDVTGDGLGNPCRRPYGVDIGPSGEVVIAGYTSDNVFRIDPGGQITELIDRDGDDQGNGLNCPLALVVDDYGNIFLSGHESQNAFQIGGTPTSFCDGWDGSLASCPCSNPGNPDTGCDISQSTGGMRLDVIGQESGALNRATLMGSGYPATTAPGVTVLRSTGIDPASPVVFGDGLRCISVPVVRVGATLGMNGVSVQTIGHSAGVGPGTFFYQLWVRNTPVMFCDPTAGFNLSNGRSITW